MKRLGLFTAAALLFASNAVAQIPPPPGGGGPGGGGPGGGGQGALNVSIATDATNVPIGTTVSLTANHDPLTDPKYHWDAACVTDVSIFPWFTNANWRGKKTISNCVGSHGTRRYKVAVEGKNAQNALVIGFAEKSVTFNKPDSFELNIEDVEQEGDRRFNQRLKITLKWNGKDVGKCADICCQESLHREATMAHSQLSGLELDVSRWPSCEEQIGGTPVTGIGAEQTSWDWTSPTLEDMQWVNFSKADYAYVNSLANGTAIAKQNHTYHISGSECPSGNKWSKDIVLKLELVVTGSAPNKSVEWRQI